MTPGCTLCHKTKAPYNCGLCQMILCKGCAIFNDPEILAMVPNRSATLSHDVYCPTCYQNKAEPELQKLQHFLKLAKNVDVFMKDQGKETRLMKRSEAPLKVEDCADHNETILRLAFLAAQAGFNTLVDVEVQGKKVRNEGYQSMIYSGTGVPVRR